MGIEQITVGGVDLHSVGNTRKIYGQPVNRRGGGVHVIACVFEVWGTSHNDLATKWNAVKTAFNRHDVTCTLTYNSDAGTKLETIALGGAAGTKQFYTAVSTSVEQSEDQSNELGITGVLIIRADYFEEEALAGQVGPILMETSVNAAGYMERTLTATFLTTGASADANYASARPTLVGSTWLDVGASGAPGGSNNLAMTLERVENGAGPNTVAVTLQATEDLGVFTTVSARRLTEFNIRVISNPEFPDDPEVGTPRRHGFARGFVVMDVRQFSGDIVPVFDSIRSEVEDRVKAESGAAELDVVVEAIEADYTQNMLLFDNEYLLDHAKDFDGQMGPITMETSHGPDGYMVRTLDATFAATPNTVPPATAQENYDAARAELMGATWLDVGADGAVGGANNLALTSESVRRGVNPETVVVSLGATEDIQVFTEIAQRKLSDFRVDVTDAPEWMADPEAGEPPRVANANGFIVVDKRVFSENLIPVFDQIRDNVRARVEAETGAAEIELISANVEADKGASRISFSAEYLLDNTTIFHYRVEESQATTMRFFNPGPDSDGYTNLQGRAGIPDMLMNRTITRRAVGKIIMQDHPADGTIFPELRGFGSFYWLQLDDNYSEDGPDRNKWSNDVWTQSLTVTVKAFKFKPGQEPGTLYIGEL